MNKRKFLSQLAITTIALAALILLLNSLPAFTEHTGFYLITVGFFFLLSLGMYYLSAQAAVSKDKNAFTRLIMLFTLLKMMLTAAIVIVYGMSTKPQGALFLLPFFVIYIVYTIFETIFMTKLGKVKAR